MSVGQLQNSHHQLRFDDYLLGGGVQARSRLVENQDWRVANDRRAIAIRCR
jgi:hypothetical protein